jgi:hypothetical protein
MRRVQPFATQHRGDLTRPGRTRSLTQNPEFVRGSERPPLRPFSQLRIRPTLPGPGARAAQNASAASGALHVLDGTGRLL